MSPPIPRIARVPLTSKVPDACPHCGGRNLTRRGTRRKKLEIVQLWRCSSCKRVFTPGPAALHNKTYPLRMILSAFTDYNTGYTLEETAFQALSAALYARRDQPRGRRIEVSLLQTASAMQVIRMLLVYFEGDQIKRAMPSGVFKTADGWLQFLVIRNDSWVKFCRIVLGTPELAADPLFANEASRMTNEAPLLAIVRPAIAGQPTAYWSERLREADIMHERLNTFREALRHPQTEAIGLISWLDVEGVPEPVPVPNVVGMPPLANGTPRATPPRLGQHTAEVLGSHGFTPADIAALIGSNVVAQA